jgi:hypothetical protein
VVGACEHCNEPLGSLRGKEFLNCLNDVPYQEGLHSMELSLLQHQ